MNTPECQRILDLMEKIHASSIIISMKLSRSGESCAVIGELIYDCQVLAVSALEQMDDPFNLEMHK